MNGQHAVALNYANQINVPNGKHQGKHWHTSQAILIDMDASMQMRQMSQRSVKPLHGDKHGDNVYRLRDAKVVPLIPSKARFLYLLDLHNPGILFRDVSNLRI